MAKTNLGKVVGDSAFEDWLKKNPGKTWEDFMEEIKGKNAILQYGLSCFMRSNSDSYKKEGWIKLRNYIQHLQINKYPHLENILEKTTDRTNFDFGNLTGNNNPKFTITPLNTGGTISNPELIYKLFTGGLDEGEEIVFEITEPLDINNKLGFELSGEVWEEIKLNSAGFCNFICALEATGSFTKPTAETLFGFKAVDSWKVSSSYHLQKSAFRVVANKFINGVFDICKYSQDNTSYIKKMIFKEGSRVEFQFIREELFIIPEKLTENKEIMYIGIPIELNAPSMYSYSKNTTYSGEIPFSLASDNKFPYYIEGITMSEPREAKIGYINKYNSESDTWELVKTHEKQEGYYYLENGDLKYTPKPNNYSIWDIVKYAWNESQELKEQEKQRLLDELIALEVKKDKMIDLDLDTNSIMEKIKAVNKEIENINR